MSPATHPGSFTGGIADALEGSGPAPMAGRGVVRGGTAGPPSPRAELDLELVRMASRGERPRCGEPSTGGNLWLSDDAEDRARAVVLCGPCPLLMACGAAADATGERFGVFGGVDRGAAARERVRAGRAA